jgi:hypothetical protein
MNEQEEKSKKKHSLGVIIQAKRQDIETVVDKNGYYPSEIINAVKEMNSEVSSQGRNDGNGEGCVVGSRGTINKGSGEDVCDSCDKREANEADAVSKVSDEEILVENN